MKTNCLECSHCLKPVNGGSHCLKPVNVDPYCGYKPSKKLPEVIEDLAKHSMIIIPPDWCKLNVRESIFHPPIVHAKLAFDNLGVHKTDDHINERTILMQIAQDTNKSGTIAEVEDHYRRLIKLVNEK